MHFYSKKVLQWVVRCALSKPSTRNQPHKNTMKNYAEIFKNLHAHIAENAPKASRIICENGLSHFWVKDFMTLGDGYTSLETLVYNLDDNTGVVTIYRPVNGRHLDKHTLDLNSF